MDAASCRRAPHLAVAPERLILAEPDIERRRLDLPILLPDSHDVHGSRSVRRERIDAVKKERPRSICEALHSNRVGRSTIARARLSAKLSREPQLRRRQM